MAILLLDRLWINRVGDGTGVGAYSAEGRQRAHSITGDVRTYGTGRRRAVTNPGVVESYKFTLILVSPADVATLQSWEGTIVQVRTSRGQRFVGTYFAAPVPTEVKDNPNQYSVDIELQSLTVPDGV